MYVLNTVILVLTFILTISLAILAMQRKKSPWYVHAVAYLIIGLCISDAILRGSFWPLGTAIVMVAVLIIRYRTNRLLDILEMKKRDQQMRDELHEQEIRNQQIRKGMRWEP